MDIKQGLRAAGRMGERAGKAFRNKGMPTRNPFPTDGHPAVAQAAEAWNAAYVTAAYGRAGGNPHPTFAAVVPGGRADGPPQTATMTAAAHTALSALDAARAAERAQYTGSNDEWAARAQASLTAAAGPNTGACLMAYLTPADAARVAIPGGETPQDLHVTLAYLAQPAAEFTPEQQQQIDAALTAAWSGPVTADAFGTALFNPDDEEREPCAVLLVQSESLAALHDATVAAIESTGTDLDRTFPTWIPHTALMYQAPDAAVIPSSATGPLTYDRLVMAWGDDKHDLTSTGTDPEPPTAEPALTAATEEQPMTSPTPPAPPAPATDAAAPVDPAAAEAGPTWSGPLALLGVPSSDRRLLGPNGTVRPLPQPLNWQHKSDDAHKGSSVVGSILQVEIRDGQIWGRGNWLPGYNDDVERARAQVDAGLGLISVDVVPGVLSFTDQAGNPIDPSTYTGDFDSVIVCFDEWEFGGATIVSFPAFADARIATDPGTEPESDEIVGGPILMPGETQTFAGENLAGPALADDGTSITLPDGSTVGVGDSVSVPAADGDTATDQGTITAINADTQTVTVTLAADGDADADDQAEPMTVEVPIAALLPGTPPVDATPAAAATGAAPAFAAVPTDAPDVLLASSFTQPYRAAAFAKRELHGPTPLTYDPATGEVWGHFAAWGECHIGKMAQDGVCVTAPESKTGYDYFHLGEVITDEGPLPVGKITVGGGHAGPRATFRGAVEHYDRTCSQVAVVRAYDDEWGGQFTGQVIPGTPQERIDEMMRAGQLSGDWRTMKGNLELVAALAVNVPGFPIKRPQVQIGQDPTGRQLSLVAAGMVAPEENTEVILPSGQRLDRADWEVLVAATFAAVQRHTAPPAEVTDLPVPDQLAARRDAARLALRRSTALAALNQAAV